MPPVLGRSLRHNDKIARSRLSTDRHRSPRPNRRWLAPNCRRLPPNRHRLPPNRAPSTSRGIIKSGSQRTALVNIQNKPSNPEKMPPSQTQASRTSKDGNVTRQHPVLILHHNAVPRDKAIGIQQLPNAVPQDSTRCVHFCERRQGLCIQSEEARTSDAGVLGTARGSRPRDPHPT